MKVYRVIYSVIGTLTPDSSIKKSECLFITFNIGGQIPGTYIVPLLVVDLIAYDPTVHAITVTFCILFGSFLKLLSSRLGLCIKSVEYRSGLRSTYRKQCRI